MNKKINIKFNEKSCSYDISYNGFTWINDGRKPFVAVNKNIGDRQKVKTLPLTSAKTKNTHYSENKIITYYSDFFLDGDKLPFTKDSFIFNTLCQQKASNQGCLLLAEKQRKYTLSF